MVRFTVDNRNRLIFYGNPVGYVKEDTAVVDEMFRTDELNQYLSRMNLTPRWEDGIFDRLVSGEVTGEEPVQPRKGCRIWQLKKDVDVAMRFIGYEDQVRKFGEPDAGNYTLVFDGDLGTSDLEQIYTIWHSRKKSFYGSTSVGKMLSRSISGTKLCRNIWRMFWTSCAISFQSGSMSASAVRSNRKPPRSVRRKKRPALMPPTM